MQTKRWRPLLLFIILIIPLAIIVYEGKGSKLRAEDIRYFKSLPGTREEERAAALTKHAEGIKLIAQQMEKEQLPFKTDLDDKDYQQYIKRFGTSPLELFGDERRHKAVIEFVKFMDLYENYDANEQLAAFAGKLKQGKRLSAAEMRQLRALQPAADDAPSTKENR